LRERKRERERTQNEEAVVKHWVEGLEQVTREQMHSSAQAAHKKRMERFSGVKSLADRVWSGVQEDTLSKAFFRGTTKFLKSLRV
jgi:hypothetical protein